MRHVSILGGEMAEISLAGSPSREEFDETLGVEYSEELEAEL